MNRHRDIQMTDLVLPQRVAESKKETEYESIQFSIIDGDPYVIINMATPILDEDGNSQGGHQLNAVRISLKNALNMNSDLHTITTYLSRMASNFNPQPF